jgi:hypothetical protein
LQHILSAKTNEILICSTGLISAVQQSTTAGHGSSMAFAFAGAGTLQCKKHRLAETATAFQQQQLLLPQQAQQQHIGILCTFSLTLQLLLRAFSAAAASATAGLCVPYHRCTRVGSTRKTCAHLCQSACCRQS